MGAAKPLLGAVDSEGADVHSGSPFAGSPAVAPELRPALAVATAVLRAVSQTPSSEPNAARLRDAAATLLAEGALGRLLAEGAVARALRRLLPLLPSPAAQRRRTGGDQQEEDWLLVE